VSSTSVALELKGHLTDVAGMPVRRMLPSAAKQAVGPFIFFDHFGPVRQQAGQQADVRPHPHIGLATVTYLFEGAQIHRDSLGTVQRIEPGAINWMQAGSGIAHSERVPPDLFHVDRDVHGLQLWAAQPVADEEKAPSFEHTGAEAIPELQLGAATVRVLVGAAFGAKSPVTTPSQTLYLDVLLPAGATLELPPLAQERAIYVVDGNALQLDTSELAPYTMAVLEPGATVMLCATADTRFVVIGGAPLDGHRHIWWNFVSSRKERIAQAAQDWDEGRFAPIPGDSDERIELPPKRPF
jgi:redox-sensitive bicupin YhaK (pirin superfamily)